jgi:hypothetical protein
MLMLFTCNAPHVFIPEDERDRAALAKAKVLKAGDPRFAEPDAKYLASCHNPRVNSTIAKNRGLAVTSPSSPMSGAWRLRGRA